MFPFRVILSGYAWHVEDIADGRSGGKGQELMQRERERDLREDATNERPTGVEGELRRNALWRFGDW